MNFKAMNITLRESNHIQNNFLTRNVLTEEKYLNVYFERNL